MRFDPNELDHTAIDLKEAARLLGRHCVGVVWRWSKKGCRPRGWQGSPLVLPTVLLGGKRLTMPHWVEGFKRELIQIGMNVRTHRRGQSARTWRQAQRNHERATAQLRSIGMEA